MSEIFSNHATGLGLFLPALPFVGLLLCLALAPLFFKHMWDQHFDKVAFFWVGLVVVVMLAQQGADGTVHDIAHTLIHDYVPFIVLLATLFVIAGGIVVTGYFDGRPWRNIQLLLVGTVLASFMGTMGAAMVLIRPLLAAAGQRRYQAHMVVFFIILVGNASGGLSPLGDPPLFLGFLRGVDFFWPMKNLWQPILLTCGMVLAMFFLVDNYLWRREGGKPALTKNNKALTIKVGYNIILLSAVVATLLGSALWQSKVVIELAGITLTLPALVRDGVLVVLAVLSYTTTNPANHRVNSFSFAPLEELAVLFFGIFITLIPVTRLLASNGDVFASMLSDGHGAPSAMAYFYLCGFFSSILDNAPTYLVFFQMAGGDAAQLMTDQRAVLAAISLGAVLMGANSYIGNAPNFMVKTIAEHYKIKTPNFFLYSFYAVLILLPSYVLISLLFLA